MPRQKSVLSGGILKEFCSKSAGYSATAAQMTEALKGSGIQAFKSTDVTNVSRSMKTMFDDGLLSCPKLGRHAKYSVTPDGRAHFETYKEDTSYVEQLKLDEL